MFNSESNSNQYNCDFDSSEILELKDTILIPEKNNISMQNKVGQKYKK